MQETHSLLDGVTCVTVKVRRSRLMLELGIVSSLHDDRKDLSRGDL